MTDEDRNRFGILLDHASERGLLTPLEYEFRLSELAEATSMDELRRIVTELPAFEAPMVVKRGKGAKKQTSSLGMTTDLPAPARQGEGDLWAAQTPTTARRKGANPWVILAVVVAVLLVAMVLLGLMVSRVSHNRGIGPPTVVTQTISPIRL